MLMLGVGKNFQLNFDSYTHPSNPHGLTNNHWLWVKADPARGPAWPGSLSYRSPHNLLPLGSLRWKQNADAFWGVADDGLLTMAQSHRAMIEMHWGDRLESLSAMIASR